MTSIIQQSNKHFIMDNTFIDYLSKIPALTESVDKLVKLTSQVLQQGIRAKMSPEDKQELVQELKEEISNTPCAAPDVSETGGLIADGVISKLGNTIEQTVRETIKDTRICIEQRHVHTTAWDLAKVAEEKTRVWLIILASLLVALSLFLAIGSYIFFHSDGYYGKEYLEVVWSDYTTEKEREALWEDIYVTGALPKYYSKSPEHFKQAMERNKAILRDRERRAKENNGRFSTVPALER